ncbi:MAG: hypothetical protein WCJ04_12720 [Actinomycetes bacterium]
MDQAVRRDDELTVSRDGTVGQPNPETAVDVWCAYSQRWVQGFRLHETLSDGKFVLLGRDSEAVLPAAFDPETVRLAGADRRSLFLVS